MNARIVCYIIYIQCISHRNGFRDKWLYSLFVTLVLMYWCANAYVFVAGIGFGISDCWFLNVLGGKGFNLIWNFGNIFLLFYQYILLWFIPCYPSLVLKILLILKVENILDWNIYKLMKIKENLFGTLIYIYMNWNIMILLLKQKPQHLKHILVRKPFCTIKIF